MIKLKPLISETNQHRLTVTDIDKNPNIARIENLNEWKWHEIDHLFDMKFEQAGNSAFILKDPPIRVYKIKKGPFIVEEPIENYQEVDESDTVTTVKAKGDLAFDQSKQLRRYTFDSFRRLIDFFDKYQQPL